MDRSSSFLSRKNVFLRIFQNILSIFLAKKTQVCTYCYSVAYLLILSEAFCTYYLSVACLRILSATFFAPTYVQRPLIALTNVR